MSHTGQLWISVAALVLYYLHAPSVSGQRIISFNALDKLHRVVYIDANDGIVVVAGRNRLIALTATLRQTAHITTGPQPDHPDCPPYPEECKYIRIPTDNDNQVLIRAGSRIAVLACGTVWQGMCSIYNVADKLATVGTPMNTSSSVNYLASRISTVAFLGTPNARAALGSMDPRGEFYVGSTYDGRPLRYHPFSVSARIFDRSGSFRLANRSSYVDVVKKLKETDRILYIHGMSNGGFAYFLTVRYGASESTAPTETWLARVCEGDYTFRTYTQLQLACRPEHHYARATAASYQQATVLGGRLWVAFDVPLNGSGRGAVETAGGSEICYFNMVDINASFRRATEECNAGKSSGKLSRFFHEDETSLNCSSRRTTDRGHVRRKLIDTSCGPGHNDFIEADFLLHGTLVASLSDRVVTSLTVLLQRGRPVAWIGDSRGTLSKHIILKDSSHKVYHAILNRGHPISASTAVDPSESYAYFIAGNAVVRIPVTSCSLYANCASCFREGSKDMGCVWCGSACVSRHECVVLSRSPSCPIVLGSVSPSQGPSSGGTLLTLRGNMFGSPDHATARMNVSVGNRSCEIIHWNSTIVKCKTPRCAECKSAVRVVIFVNDTYRDDVKTFDILDSASSNFHYETPVFNSIRPNYGPRFGGTNVTMHGTHLDIGLVRSVTIGNNSCQIFRVTNTSIHCTTSRWNESSDDNMELQAALAIDGQKVDLVVKDGLGVNFTYKPDPFITEIHPTTAMFRSGTKLTALGRHLDSVAKPIMITQVASFNDQQHENISGVCIPAVGGESMQCPVPSLFDASVLNASELGEHQRPILVQVLFQMDGLRLPNNSYREDGFEFLYRPPPRFDVFPEGGLNVQVKHPKVEITGRNFEVIMEQANPNIKIGDEDHACNVTKITTVAITCVLHTNRFGDKLVHPVGVVIGKDTYPVGAIKLVSEDESSHVGIIVGSLSAVLLLVTAIVVVCRKRLVKSRPVEYFMDFCVDTAVEERPSKELRVSLGGIYQGDGTDVTQPLMDSSPPFDNTTKAMLEEENLLFKRDQLLLGDVIGQGHFGCVYHGILKRHDNEEAQPVAVKTIRNCSRQGVVDEQAFLEEALIMKNFEHPNVLPLIGLSIDDGGHLMVVIPYMRYGDLLSYVRLETDRTGVKDMLRYGLHVAEGMTYLSNIKFVHRDLAARNCMLSEDFTVRVADFGLSRDVYETEYYSCDNKKKLPVKWMAPESLAKGIYNHKTDVWAYGVLLWELMSGGESPYPEVGNWEMVNYLKQGRRMCRPSLCPDALYDVMLQCWDDDPDERPSFSCLVETMGRIDATLVQELSNAPMNTTVTYVNCPGVSSGDGATHTTTEEAA